MTKWRLRRIGDGNWFMISVLSPYSAKYIEITTMFCDELRDLLDMDIRTNPSGHQPPEAIYVAPDGEIIVEITVSVQKGGA